MFGLKQIIENDWQLNESQLSYLNKNLTIKAIHKNLSIYCSLALQNNKLPISIAGDCCSSIAVSAALQKANLNPLLIWFDAHGDFNTFETTISGHLGGMPLAMLVGIGDQQFLNSCGAKPFDQTNIILTDGRDLDVEEKILVEQSSIKHLHTIGELLDVSFGDRNIYVHFDTDILHPKDAPAQNYLAKGGPSIEELTDVFRYLSKQNIVAISVSSWNPELDVEGKTAENCMKLLNELIPKAAAK